MLIANPSHRFRAVCGVNTSGEPPGHHPGNVGYEPNHKDHIDDDEVNQSSIMWNVIVTILES